MMNVARYLIPVCSYHFVVALWRGKQAESTNIKPRKTTIAILAALAASLALAEDFKTINGKQYKDATINGVEPDGIVLKTKSGIIKVYFIELPKEVQDFFHYNATEGDEYSRKQKEAESRLTKGYYHQDSVRGAGFPEKSLASRIMRYSLSARAKDPVAPTQRPVTSSYVITRILQRLLREIGSQ
jgi:hypothetical protein